MQRRRRDDVGHDMGGAWSMNVVTDKQCPQWIDPRTHHQALQLILAIPLPPWECDGIAVRNQERRDQIDPVPHHRGHRSRLTAVVGAKNMVQLHNCSVPQIIKFGHVTRVVLHCITGRPCPLSFTVGLRSVNALRGCGWE
jgi:hypothetical protein